MTEGRPSTDSAAAENESAEIEGVEEDAGALARPALAPDDPVLAPDDDQVRRVIDALLHPTRRSVATGSRGQPDRAEASEPPAARLTVPSAGNDDLRLYRPVEWRWLLEAEHARARRYGTRSTVVQLEVVGIADIAAHLGDDAARRLVSVLADTLHEDTRAADAYARTDRWVIAGLLAETDDAAAAHPIGRVEEGFARRLGGRLAMGLAVGRAELDPRLDPAAVVAAAEHSMHLEARRLSAARPASDLSEAPAGGTGTGPVVGGTASAVRESLHELERLLAEGLVDDDEYHATRLEILHRI